MLVTHAAARLEAQLQDSDELATKALGVLAVDVSALAVLVAGRDDLWRFWWLPALGFVASAVLLLATVWPRTFDVGPDPTSFYEEMGGGTELAATEQMLTELTLSLDRNDGPLSRKNGLFKAGFAVLIIASAGTLIVVLSS